MKTDEAVSLLQAIQQDIQSGELILPTLPETAFEIQRILQQNPECSVDAIAKIVATDIATASRLIQVANSSLYGSKPINSLKSAVQLLGNVSTQNLVISFVLKQLFDSNSHYQQHYLKKVWEQSVIVASLCRAFSLFTPHLDPETAMLAGLVHQIGKLPILRNYPKESPDHSNKEILEYVLEQVHFSLGSKLLLSWQFPGELIDVPLEYSRFDRQHDHAADYIDLVQVSFLQTVIGTAHRDANRDWSSVMAFTKCGLHPDVVIQENSELMFLFQSTKSLLKQ